MSGKRDLILAGFEKLVRVLQAPGNVNVEEKVTLKGTIAKVRELPESSRSNGKPDCFEMILKLTREVQLLIGLVKLKALKLQTMAGIVEDASRLQVEFPKAPKVKRNKYRLSAESRAVVELRTENS